MNSQPLALLAPGLLIAMCEYKLFGIHLVMQSLHPPNHLRSQQTKFDSHFLEIKCLVAIENCLFKYSLVKLIIKIKFFLKRKSICG
jgi:hypothetical protein